MAILNKLVEISGKGPGFLLPVFVSYAGANSETIQVLNQNVIEDFQIIEFDQETALPCEQIEAHCGSDAIWAFRFEQEVFLGDRKRLESKFEDLLASDSSSYPPLIISEIIFFLGREKIYVDHLVRIFEFQLSESNSAASVWRDIGLFLPLIRKGIAVETSRAERNLISHVFVYTTNSRINIYVPTELHRNDFALLDFRYIAKFFKITEYKIIQMAKETSRETQLKIPCCTMFGRGSSSKLIVDSVRLNESRKNYHLGYYEVAGNSYYKSSIPFVAGMCTSNLKEVEFVNGRIREFSGKIELRHLINIRPIGFGTPSSQSLSPRFVKDLADNYDLYWLVTKHRQQKPVSVAAGLSASRIAQRSSRSLFYGLVEAHAIRSLQDFMTSPKRAKSIGLTGHQVFDESIDERLLIKRILYGMLCEEADLSSAKKITIFWPAMLSSLDMHKSCTIGSRTYEIELFERHKQFRKHGIACLAFDVRLNERNQSNFNELLDSLFAGYGWDLYKSRDNRLHFTKDDENLQIVACTTRKDLYRSIGESHSKNELIITNIGLSKENRFRAHDKGHSVIHFSELRPWMLNKMRCELLAG